MSNTLTTQQLVDNYNELLSLIDKHISSPRKEQLKQLYDDHADRIASMPASGVEHHHNCFVGGYVAHVIGVVKTALKIRALWIESGATLVGSEEELVFAAINHDLGKIGTEQEAQYQNNDSEWHRKNQGKLYKNNIANPFMTIPDRSLKLLADRKITVSDGEWYAIKLHDGLYDDCNKPYYVSHDPNSKLRTDLPYILHQADLLAARVEYEAWLCDKTKADKIAADQQQKTTSQLKSRFDQLFTT